jgi:hypothetical protein
LPLRVEIRSCGELPPTKPLLYQVVCTSGIAATPVHVSMIPDLEYTAVLVDSSRLQIDIKEHALKSSARARSDYTQHANEGVRAKKGLASVADSRTDVRLLVHFDCIWTQPLGPVCSDALSISSSRNLRATLCAAKPGDAAPAPAPTPAQPQPQPHRDPAVARAPCLSLRSPRPQWAGKRTDGTGQILRFELEDLPQGAILNTFAPDNGVGKHRVMIIHDEGDLLCRGDERYRYTCSGFPDRAVAPPQAARVHARATRRLAQALREDPSRTSRIGRSRATTAAITGKKARAGCQSGRALTYP